jgi:putative ABC transport system permease protein
MSFIELLRMVTSNLLRMKARLVMTSAGVVIGSAAVMLLISLGIGLQESTLKSFGQIGELTELEVNPNFDGPSAPGGGAREGGAARKPKLDRAMLNEISEIPGVVAVTPMLRLDNGGAFRYNRMFGGGDVRGVDPARVEALGFKLASGSTRLAKGQIIVGASILGTFSDPSAPPRQEFTPITDSRALQGKKLELQLFKTDTDGTFVERLVKLTVAGVLTSTGGQKDYTVYLAESDVIEFNAWTGGKRANPARDGYAITLVRTKSPDDSTVVQQRILEKGFAVNSPLDIIKSLNASFRTIQAILGGIGAVALLVAAFGIANTMIMAIYERRREIGLMKAVGATNRDIMFVFLGEAAAIGLLGGIGGTLVALAAGRVVTSLLQSGGGIAPGAVEIVTPLWLILAGIGLAMLVGLVSGAYPALRTTRLDPIAALKTE